MVHIPAFVKENDQSVQGNVVSDTAVNVQTVYVDDLYCAVSFWLDAHAIFAFLCRTFGVI